MRIVDRLTASSAAPPAVVWQRLLDGRRWGEWDAATAWMVVDDRLAAGRYLTIKPQRGRQTAYEIVALEPGRLLSYQMSFGPLARIRTTWELQPSGAGSAIAWSVGIGGPLAEFLVRKAAARTAAEMRATVVRLAEFAARAERT